MQQQTTLTRPELLYLLEILDSVRGGETTPMNVRLIGKLEAMREEALKASVEPSIAAENSATVLESLVYRLHRHQVPCDVPLVQETIQALAQYLHLRPFELALFVYWLLRNGLKDHLVYGLFLQCLREPLKLNADEKE